MTIESTDALIVVDVQIDFCPGGTLEVRDGDAVIDGINEIMSRFDHVVLTRDWHPANHCSFSVQPQFVDRSWPSHCVMNTGGAEFHPRLLIPNDAVIVNKGTDPTEEAYSGFDRTDLAETLRDIGVARVFVCGLATDYCVRATALDAVKHGFETVLIQDLCRGVDNPKGSVAAALEDMKSAGIAFVQSGDLT